MAIYDPITGEKCETIEQVLDMYTKAIKSKASGSAILSDEKLNFLNLYEEIASILIFKMYGSDSDIELVHRYLDFYGFDKESFLKSIIENCLIWFNCKHMDVLPRSYLYDAQGNIKDPDLNRFFSGTYNHSGKLTLESYVNLHRLEVVWDVFSRAYDYEVAGNYEKAASIFEEWEIYSQAAAVRSRKPTEKKVVVDLNKLLEQIRSGGLALNYKCNNCGATITIDGDTKNGGPKFCQYCGGKIDTEALSNFIIRALS